MRSMSIATRLFLLQLAIILGLAATAVLLSWADARADVERDAAARSIAVAETLAQDPFVLEGALAPDPSAVLQPYAVAVMEAADVDFITIMSPAGIRYTHRDPAEIGKPFLGTIDRALAGESFTETYTGTLGPSVRGVVPVQQADGTVVALVSAGITVSNTQVALGARIATVLVAAALAVLAGALASWALSRYLRRVTQGRGAEEMGRMFAYYEGVLHAIGEGLVLQDAARRVVLYNDRAAELLGLPPLAGRIGRAAAPRPVDALDVPDEIRAVLTDDAPAVDEIVITATHVLVVDRDRVVAPDAARFAGTVTTIRDHTRLQELAGELATLTTLSDALRSQAHEFANRLHTMVALIELDRPAEAAALAASELELSQRLADRLLTAAEEPVLLALLLGKAAQAAERGIRFEVTVPERLEGGLVPARELITIVGNLIDNALDAAAATPAPVVEVRVEARTSGGDPEPAELRIRVADSGSGPGDAVADSLYELGTTSKRPTTSDGRRGIGLALVRQSVARLGGTITLEGSAFTVVLPTSVAAPAAARVSAVSGDGDPGD